MKKKLIPKRKRSVVHPRKHIVYLSKRYILKNQLESMFFFFALLLIPLVFLGNAFLGQSFANLSVDGKLASLTGQASLHAPNDGENKMPQSQMKNDHVIFHGLREKKEIALTFDADMTPWMKKTLESGKVKSYYDEKSLKVLTDTNTPATFFLTGMWIELYPDVTKQLSGNPLFELGNHSYSHPSFAGFCYGLSQIPTSDDQQEINKTQALLKDYTGTDNTLFRFPGGCYSSETLATAEHDNLYVIQWDVAGEDGFNDFADKIKYNVLSNVKNGSIIVLHFNGYPNEPKTAEVLPEIISTLKSEGYTFVKVTDLINDLQNSPNAQSDSSNNT